MTVTTVSTRVEVDAPRQLARDVSEFIRLESAGGNIRPRMHTRMAIVGVRAGSMIRVESRRTVVVEHDCLLIVPPLHLYGLRSVNSGGPPVVTLLVEIPQLTVTELLLPGLVSVPSLHEAWVAFIGGSEVSVTRVERALALRALIERWIEQSTPLPAIRGSDSSPPLRPLRDFMRAHVNERIPTTALVEKSGLTASHCIREFGREFGLPPHAYHVQLRLAAACEMLAQGERVATVAYDCGFADQSHLSRKFREAYDIAPAAWAALVKRTVLNTSGASRITGQPGACQQLAGGTRR